MQKTQLQIYDPRPGLPLLYDEDAGERLIEHLSAEHGRELLVNQYAFLKCVGSCSPYLSRLIKRHAQWLREEVELDLAQSIKKICLQTERRLLRLEKQNTREAQKKILRQAKDHAALIIAFHDLKMACTVMEACFQLSFFADYMVRLSLKIATQNSFVRDEIDQLPDDSIPGLTIVAMGKHGARELNYSSDIDLIAFYDPELVPANDGHDPKKIAITIIRDVVDLLSDQTADGYVFRTDLRLRPDPGVSAVAISVCAAESYYEAHGQNWERAAYIKARVIAGDFNTGKQFLKRLHPFIWRKYLDFAAIDDIENIRRKILAQQRGQITSAEGFDVKLGVGGIRQIEFFVQVQQLIAGGKNEDLRCADSLGSLKKLRNNALLSSDDAQCLNHCYQALRFIEHRLQMINDAQTHKLPTSQGELLRLANFCGFESVLVLTRTIQTLRQQVVSVQQEFDAYTGLKSKNGDANVRASDEILALASSLNFTDVSNDHHSIEVLQEIGLSRASEVSKSIHGWYDGRYRSTRTARSRSLIDQFLPKVLCEISRAADPDEAFFCFDKFLQNLPSGVQIFSLFVINPMVFESLIQILTFSPKLGQELSRRRGFLEALINGGWLATGSVIELAQELERQVTARHGELDLEDIMNVSRRLVGEARFMTAAQLATGQTSIESAALSFSQIAQHAIATIEPAAQSAMEGQFGTIKGGLCVIGFGRLGCQRMSVSSDIDIVFVYETDINAKSSGPKELDSVSWYTRKVRRMVTALSADTQEGRLYEVDMKLRPSGGAGPAAVKLSAFERYYETDAWVWELMALTKAKVIYGPDVLREKISSFITKILSVKRNAHQLADEVRLMRKKLLQEKPAQSIWQRKISHGGMTDIEFILEYLILAHAHEIGVPPGELMQSGNCSFFVEHEKITIDEAKILQSAFILNENIIQLSRLGLGSRFDPSKDSKVLTAKLIEVCGVKTLDAAEGKLAKSDERVIALFEKLVA